MLGSFLWAAHRQVQSTLIRSAHQRAQIAADQIASMLRASIAARLAETRELALDPAIASYLRSPTAQTREAALEVLAAITEQPFRRVELWNESGELVLEIATPAVADSGAAPRFLPAGPPPAREGVSELQAIGDANFFHMVVGIRDGSSPTAARLGYLRRFGRITSTAGGAVRRLIGSEAVVRVGTVNGIWTDFFSIQDAPPGSASPGTGTPFRAADNRHLVGAVAPIEGSPWVAWVGFPRAVVVAPAWSFLQRMVLLALLFLLVGLLLVIALAVRITQPLHALVHAAEEIAAGNYKRRVWRGRRDEIGRLSDAFDTMAGRIETAHEALRESHQRTHFALAAAGIGVWVTEIATGEIACSDSMRLVHDLSPAELPRDRDDFIELVHPEDREAVRDLLEGRSADDNAIFDVDYRALRPDGSTHWIEGKGRIQVDSEGRPVSVLGVSMDVTARRRLELQLRQSQKLEAVGLMAGGISHDFNNLLNVIKGCAYLLHQDLPQGSPLQEDAAEIERAADRAASLTQQLLAFSRKQVLQPEVVSPNDLVIEVVKLIGRTIREDIDIVTRLEPRLRQVEVDSGQLHQVLMNLAMNAQDAMPDGGVLTIETYNTDLSEVDVSKYPYLVKPGAYACLCVSDDGIGMDRETRTHVFEPFFTTKGMGKGTGLGLATVYGIVKQSGGYIWVESEPGEGSAFQIYLPRAVSQQAEENSGPAPASAEGRGETILVVEDDAGVRKLFRRVLESGGYSVLHAANGEDALRAASHHDGPIDLVVSDVIMPVMSGTEMAEHLSRIYGPMRLLYTSGYAEEEIARHGINASSTAFLQKPIAPDVLLEKVRLLLDSDSRKHDERARAGNTL